MATFARTRSRETRSDYEYRYRTSTGSIWRDESILVVPYIETISEEFGPGMGLNSTLRKGIDRGQALRIRKRGYKRFTTVQVQRPLFEGTLGGGRLSGEPIWLVPYDAPNLNRSWEAKLVADASPTNPSFNARTAFAEIAIDGLPRLGLDILKDASKFFRGAGSDYLNFEFGWKPLIKDLRTACRTVQRAHKVAEQYMRDANRPVRRRRSIISDPTTRSLKGSGNTNVWASLITSVRYEEKRELSRWFSGQFKYFVPVGDSMLEQFVRWNTLANRTLGLGLVPRPADVWEIAPWSWLVDWFTNVGAVLQNAQALGFDGQVLEYGYGMTHSYYENSQDFHFSGFSGSQVGSVYPYDWGFTWVDEWKLRDRANPYGFGVTDAQLSLKQLSILAALGLSRT